VRETGEVELERQLRGAWGQSITPDQCQPCASRHQSCMVKCGKLSEAIRLNVLRNIDAGRLFVPPTAFTGDAMDTKGL
jgi:hypothetical protein